MKSLVEIPIRQYNELLTKCSASDGERSILESAIVLQDVRLDGERRVAILCDSDQAKKIIDFASRLYPEAALSIREFNALEG